MRNLEKEINLTNVEKGSTKETPPLFRKKLDYKEDTNDKTRGSEDPPSETDGCVRNLSKEYGNEDDE